MDEILAREFVAAANRMQDSLTLYQVDQSLGHRESGGLLIQCATTGCSLLSNDAYVQALVDDAHTFRRAAAGHYADIHAIMGVDHFEFFLQAETRLLEQAGADSGLVEAIVGRCRETREAARQGKFNANAFRDTLGELRFAVCGVLAELRKATFDQRPPEQLSRRLMAVVKGVSGCVVVGLDASPLVAVALSPAGSAVSIAVGCAIVSDAFNDLKGAGRHRRMWSWRRFRPQ